MRLYLLSSASFPDQIYAAPHSVATMPLAGLSRWTNLVLLVLLHFPLRVWTDGPSPLSVNDFAKMFDIAPGTGNGSCLRTWKPSPYPTQRTGFSISLQALADAKDMSTVARDRMSDYITQHTDSQQDKNFRLLLFLFFGITFNEDFSPKYPSSVRYIYVLSALYQYHFLDLHSLI